MRKSEHERRQRVGYGIRQPGEGKVFKVSEEMIHKEVLNPAQHSVMGCGSGDRFRPLPRTSVCCVGAWDRTNDVINNRPTLRVHGGLPINHASAMRSAMNGLPSRCGVMAARGHAPSREKQPETMQLHKAGRAAHAADPTQLREGRLGFEAAHTRHTGRLASSKLRVAANRGRGSRKIGVCHRGGGW